MFTPERYVADFLNKKPVFNPPGNIFKPSMESTEEKEYRSPLIDSNEGFGKKFFEEKINFNDEKNQNTQNSTHEDLSAYKIIDEDASLEDIIASFNSSNKK
jgi:hypothetical protein